MTGSMPTSGQDALDRHALVLAVWLPCVLAAAALFHFGFASGGWRGLAGGFLVIVGAFLGHVLINLIQGTRFTAKEVALGLVVYCVGALAFSLELLLSREFRAEWILPVSLGFLGTAAVVIATMVLWLGLRGAFEAFDVIRRFKP
jgi:hypothetical protein